MTFPQNSSSDDKFPDGRLPLRKRAATGIAVIFTGANEKILNFKMEPSLYLS